MTNKRIQDLPAGVTLTGTELLEMEQSAASARTTAQDVANLAIASAVSQVTQAPYIVPEFTLQTHRQGRVSPAGSWDNSMMTVTFEGTASVSFADSLVPSSSLYKLTVGMKADTNAGLNTNAGGRMASFNTQQVYMRCSGSHGKGGMKARFTFSFYTSKSDQRVYIGYDNLLGLAQTPTVEPSTYTTCVYLGKDSSDTNLQIMFNDGSGTCTKVNTGIAFTSVTQKLLALDMYGTPDGNVLITLRNLDTGGSGTLLGTWNTGTSNIPAIDTLVGMRAMVNTGPSTTTAVSIKIVQLDQVTDYFM